jgi:hypothetical protein
MMTTIVVISLATLYFYLRICYPEDGDSMFSEKPVCAYKTMWCHNPEDHNLAVQYSVSTTSCGKFL